MASEAAKTLLRSTAPGQFDIVAENIQKLGRQSLTDDSWLEEASAELNTFRCIGMDNDSISHPLAGSLQEKLKAYQEKTFSSAKGLSTKVVLQEGESGSLLVHTYAEKLDLPNHYTGFWKATWTITGVSTDEATISGEAQLHTCSYEDGNNQLTLSKPFQPTKVGKSSPKDSPNELSLAQGVVDQILKWEHEVLDIFGLMHETSSDHLRKIRRVLPITKTKMKWDVVAQRSVQMLKKTAKR